MSTDATRRAEAQRLLLAEILHAATIGQSLAARERQRLLNATAQRPATAPQQPITDATRRAEARRLTMAQTLGPRPQSRPQTQAQGTGMDGQSREFFERQRLLNAQAQRQTQPTAPPHFDPSADDRIARKLNAIVKRSDIEVSQVNGAIEIRQRGRMRDELIRAYLAPRTVSSSTPRYR